MPPAVHGGNRAAIARRLGCRPAQLLDLSASLAPWGPPPPVRALLLAALIGKRVLGNFGIPLPMLALAAGIILFLNALQVTLQQFSIPTAEPATTAVATPESISRLALAPLAFPTIVTPYGIAALVVFLALSPDSASRLKLWAVVLAIMVLNLVVMLLTRHIVRVLLLGLTILGAVLGVVQVALGLQIMFRALTTLGVL